MRGGLLAGFLILLLAWPASSQEPIKIGVLMPLSGPFAAGGVAALQSLRLAEETINAEGGISGRRVVLVGADSQGRAEIARTEALRLVEREGVWALVGAYLSEETLPVQDIAADKQVLHMVPVAATMEVNERVATDPRFRFTFRVSYNIAQWAALLGTFLERAGSRQYAFVGVNIRWNRELLDHLKSLLAGKVELVYEGFYSPQAPQMEPLVVAIRERRPDFVVLGDPGAGAIEFVKRARELDLQSRFLSVGGALGDARVAAALPSGEYLYFQAATWRGLTPQATQYFSRFQKRYQYLPVGYSDTLPHDALTVLAQAAVRARSLMPADVIRALEQGQFPGVAGIYTFDRSHQAIWGQGGLKGAVIQWVNGSDRVIVSR